MAKDQVRVESRSEESVGKTETHQSDRLVDGKCRQFSEECKGCMQTDGLLLLFMAILITILVGTRRLPFTTRGRVDRLFSGDGDIPFSGIDEE
jgi:hypothetical protein